MTIPGLGLLEVRGRSPASLIPYANNSRKHSDEQVNAIASSIKEFGFLQPVVIDQADGIIAGHARVQAAIKLGLSEVPTIEASHLTPAQVKLFCIADNRLSELSSWNNDVLQLELANLEDMGVTWDWLEMPPLPEIQMLDPVEPNEAQDDPAPPVPEPRVVLGDLFRIGAHLVLCGDSTNPDHVARVLDGANPNLCVTDPTYGVNYDANWRNEALGPGAASSTGKVENDGKIVWTDALSLFTGNVFYVWHAGRHATSVAISLADMDFEIRCQIIWAKNNFAISRGHYHWKHEPCWYAVKRGQRSNWKGDRKSTTLWEVPMIVNNSDLENQKTGHSTQKPVELYVRPYKNHCEPGEHVYEPFLGSGSALIAASKCGLVCHAIEISPAYVEAALERYRKVFEVDAVHVESGMTLAELQATRGTAKAS